MKRRSVQNTEYLFDLRIAHRLKSHAIFLRSTVPADNLMKVVKRHEDASQGEILFDKRRIKFEQKFVIFVRRKVRMQHNKLWVTISELTDRF